MERLAAREISGKTPVFPGAGGGPVDVRAWAKSDVGRQRTINEDCHYVDPDVELILVLDGMGGHRAGEVASLLAMETISTFYKENSAKPTDNTDMFENYDPSFSYHSNLLRQAVFNANRLVLDESRGQDEYVGMGSTVTGLAINDYSLTVINVGDSRVYLIRDGVMEQISKDHTLAEDQVERGIITREEAHESQLKHILSSVIGVDGRIRIHMDELVVVPGDMFLLCTDGLTAVMKNEEIKARILMDEPGPQTLTRLIKEVNDRGGPDNVTLALAVFRAEQKAEKGSRFSSLLSKALGGRTK